MYACLCLDLSISVYRVQDYLPREWCHPWWTDLPTPIHVAKTAPSPMPTDQPYLDFEHFETLSCEIPSLVIVDHCAISPPTHTHTPTHTFTHISLSIHLSIVEWESENSQYNPPSHTFIS